MANTYRLNKRDIRENREWAEPTDNLVVEYFHNRTGVIRTVRKYVSTAKLLATGGVK